MTDPQLLERARAILAKASVLAEAPGVSYIPSGRHAHESKDPTTGTGMAVFDYVTMVLRDAEGRGPRSMRDAVDRAERAVERMRHAPTLTGRQKKLIDTEGLTCNAAALELSVNHVTVWRWRVQSGRYTSCGHLKPADDVDSVLGRCRICTRALA